MGRSNEEVRYLGALIPAKPIDQSVWKGNVCQLYATGVPVAEAIDRATAAIRLGRPDFQPRYNPAILDL